MSTFRSNLKIDGQWFCAFFFEDGTKMKVPAENKPPLNLNQTVNTEKQQKVCVLLGSYYKYWPYKCFDPYFLDQPVRIFVNGGRVV